MKIRQETPADYAEVYELVKISFATSTNEGEWDYLNEVRKKAAFIPELSLVAKMTTAGWWGKSFCIKRTLPHRRAP